MSDYVNELNAQILNEKCNEQDVEIAKLKKMISNLEQSIRGTQGRVQELEKNLAIVVAGGYGSGPTA